MSRHRYLYGNANPVTYVDPSGEMSIADQLGAIRMLDTLLGISLVGAGTLAAILHHRLTKIWTGEINLSMVDPSGLNLGFVDVLFATGEATAWSGNKIRTYNIKAFGFGASFGLRGLGNMSGENSTRNLSLDFIVEVSPGSFRLPPNELAGQFFMGLGGAFFREQNTVIEKRDVAELQMGPGRGFANATSIATAESRFNLNTFIGRSEPTKQEPSNNTPNDS